MTIKARHDYLTVQRDPRVPSERVRVLGFENVRIGSGATERDEQWCRVRFYADGARLLMHPTSLQA